MKKKIFLLIYFISISSAYATTQYEKDPHEITINDILNWYQADIGLEKEPPGVDKHPFNYTERNIKSYLYDGQLRGWAYEYYQNGRFYRKLYFNPDISSNHDGFVRHKEFDYHYYQNDVYAVFGDGENYPMFWLKNGKPYNGMLIIGNKHSSNKNALAGDLESPSDNSDVRFKLYVKNGYSNGIAEINFSTYQKGNFKNGFKHGNWNKFYAPHELESYYYIKYNMGKEIEKVKQYPSYTK